MKDTDKHLGRWVRNLNIILNADPNISKLTRLQVAKTVPVAYVYRFHSKIWRSQKIGISETAYQVLKKIDK